MFLCFSFLELSSQEDIRTVNSHPAPECCARDETREVVTNGRAAEGQGTRTIRKKHKTVKKLINFLCFLEFKKSILQINSKSNLVK